MDYLSCKIKNNMNNKHTQKKVVIHTLSIKINEKYRFVCIILRISFKIYQQANSGKYTK